MQGIDNQYERLLQYVIDHGVDKDDRTGTGTWSIFGHQLRYDLSNGFPLITTKKVHFKSIVSELKWFLKGGTNVKALHEDGVTIWDEWADPDTGELGPVYGKQWRAWETTDGRQIDQIQQVIDTLKKDPDSRRMIVSAWNVGELDKMALAPCHVLFQFYAHDNKLSCHVFQRSADIFLGLPFNIAAYALLTHVIACICNMRLGDLIWSGGDCHLYKNHIEQAKEQLSRDICSFPDVVIQKKPSTEQYVVHLIGYNSHPAIKAPISI